MCFTSITPYCLRIVSADTKRSCVTQVYYCWADFKGYAQVPGLNVAMHIPQAVQTTQSFQVALDNVFMKSVCES